ncbi:hypothetical protein chiPu_0000787 [Chiloscyllium punctatum]|uniref:Replication factor A C-terminal domain-containing protein n=1 Tax=Chiloscyllium punctatum TaxID=137246 RepID=A0A401RW75_CHIPU|nr:hypothetical protein [Chiloscyllium punctatum]
MYLKPGNHMNMKRSFIVASILCLRDTCFLYPACYECGSRLLLNLGRYHCLKHGYVSTAQDMHYRYRLSVKVARKNDIFNITVFGSCLEPYFGETAGCLQRYCEGLKKKLQEQKEKKNQDLLVQAVKYCFIGRSFIFGVKASEFLPSTWSPSLSPLQAPISMKRYETHLVACQIAKDCVNSSFNKQRYCLQNSGDSLSNGKDCDENQSIDKSYNLSEDSMDHIDPTLWDDLLFSESLDEFIAKVEANQQRCDEEDAVDGSIHSCSLKKLKTDILLNRTRGQSPRCKEVCTNSTNCNLKRPREFGTKESPCVYSKNPKGLLNRVVDVFKSDITRKENSLATAPPVLPVDGSIPNDTYPPTQDAVLQIYSTFVNPVNVGNCSTKCVRTCEPKLHNLEEEPLDEYSKFLSEHKATEVNKLADPFYIANESDLLNNIGFQTRLPSGKQILKMKKSIDHEFQDSMRIKGHDIDVSWYTVL